MLVESGDDTEAGSDEDTGKDIAVFECLMEGCATANAPAQHLRWAFIVILHNMCFISSPPK